MTFSLIEEFSDLSVSEWVLFALCAALVILSVALLVRKKASAPSSVASKGVDTQALVMGALCISLSFVLSYIKLFELPQGGSITPASTLPIMAYAYYYGPKKGFLAALAFSMLQFIQRPIIVHLAQFFLDYTLPYTALGITSLFAKKRRFLTGITAAVLCRVFFHFLSGWIFFGMYAPAGMNPALYSLVYQLASICPDGVICLVVAAIPQTRRVMEQMSGRSAAKA